MANLYLFGYQKPFVTLGLPLPGVNTKLIEGKWILLAHGGRGSGKSMGGAFKAALYGLLFPGARITVTAPTYRMLADYTLEALFEVFGILGLKPRVHYEYIKNEKIVNLLSTGSKYFLISTDNPEVARGGNLAAFWMDEARESPYTAFTNLSLSLRQGGYPHMGWITTTPVGRLQWIYDTFFTKKREGFNSLTFAAPTRENPFPLPDGMTPDEALAAGKGGGQLLYEANVELLGGANSPLARQELGGEFVVAEGLVFPQFRPDYHVKPVVAWPIKPRYVLAGIDFGWSAETAILVEGYTPIDTQRGYRFLMNEFYETHVTQHELVEVCKLIMKKYNASLFPCDSADPQAISFLRANGIPAYGVKKRNTVVFRKAICSAALLPGEEQLFFVAPHLKDWRIEIENYTESPEREGVNPSEKPRQLHDHMMDAWGYAELAIERFYVTRDQRQKIFLEL